MFTLGDVADILDGALDTGISIIDTLSQLSDVADKEGLDREKCFERLNLPSQRELIDDKCYSQTDDSSVEAHVSVNHTDCDRIQKCSSPPHHNAIYISSDASEAAGRSHDNNDEESDVNNNSHGVQSDTVNVIDTENQSVIHTIKQSRPTKASVQRRSTFVLKDSPVKTVEDATTQGIPIIAALGDLCNVTDNFLKDYNSKSVDVGDNDGGDVDGNKNSTLMSEEKNRVEMVITIKVNEILESFKQLDSTVDMIKKKALKSHLSHFQQVDSLTTRLPVKYQELLTAASSDTQSSSDDGTTDNLTTDLMVSDDLSLGETSSSNNAPNSSQEEVDMSSNEQPKLESNSRQGSTEQLLQNEQNIRTYNNINEGHVTRRTHAWMSETNPPKRLFHSSITHRSSKTKPNASHISSYRRHKSVLHFPEGTSLFPVDVDIEPRDEEMTNDTGEEECSLNRDRPGTYVISSKSSNQHHDQPAAPASTAKTNFFNRNDRPGTYVISKKHSIESIQTDHKDKKHTTSKQQGDKHEVILQRTYDHASLNGRRQRAKSMETSYFNRHKRPGTRVLSNKNKSTESLTSEQSLSSSVSNSVENVDTENETLSVNQISSNEPRQRSTSVENSYFDRHKRPGTYVLSNKKTSTESLTSEKSLSSSVSISVENVDTENETLSVNQISPNEPRQRSTSVEISYFDRHKRPGTYVLSNKKKSTESLTSEQSLSSSVSISVENVDTENETMSVNQISSNEPHQRSTSAEMSYFDRCKRPGTYVLSNKKKSTECLTSDQQDEDFNSNVNNNSKGKSDIKKNTTTVRHGSSNDLGQRTISLNPPTNSRQRTISTDTYFHESIRGVHSEDQMFHAPTNVIFMAGGETNLESEKTTGQSHADGDEFKRIPPRRSLSSNDSIVPLLAQHETMMSKASSSFHIPSHHLHGQQQSPSITLTTTSDHLVAYRDNPVGALIRNSVMGRTRNFSIGSNTMESLNQLKKAMSKSLTKLNLLHDVQRHISLSNSSLNASCNDLMATSQHSHGRDEFVEVVTEVNNSKHGSGLRRCVSEPSLIYQTVRHTITGDKNALPIKDIMNKKSKFREKDKIVSSSSEMDEVETSDEPSISSPHETQPKVVLREKRGRRQSNNNTSTYVLCKAENIDVDSSPVPSQNEIHPSNPTPVADYQMYRSKTFANTTSLNKEETIRVSPRNTRKYKLSRKSRDSSGDTKKPGTSLRRQNLVEKNKKPKSPKRYPTSDRMETVNDVTTTTTSNISSKLGKQKPPIHTNFLKRKIGLNASAQHRDEALGGDVPLSSRLAALRLQLEEKRRQFEEEKKLKLKEWNQERAENLQKGFFISFDGKENLDPSECSEKEPSDRHQTNDNSEIPQTVSAKDFIAEKRLEKRTNDENSAGTWFVDFHGSDAEKPERLPRDTAETVNISMTAESDKMNVEEESKTDTVPSETNNVQMFCEKDSKTPALMTSQTRVTDKEEELQINKERHVSDNENEVGVKIENDIAEEKKTLPVRVDSATEITADLNVNTVRAADVINYGEESAGHDYIQRPLPFPQQDESDEVKTNEPAVETLAECTMENKSVPDETPSKVLMPRDLDQLDDQLTQTPGLTPEQQKKKDRFIRNRQKKIEEERRKKELEAERKKQEFEADEQVLTIAYKLRMEEDEDEKQIKRIDSAQPCSVSSPQKYTHDVTQRASSAKSVRKRTDDVTVPHATSPRSVVALTDDPGMRKGFREYTGPTAYQKPTGKSNRKIIHNAISHCCLSGGVNRDAQQKCLQAIDLSEANHFVVLFRDGMKFRSVYEYYPETETVTKIYGIGPKTITSKMTDKFYRYYSGGKKFDALLMKELSIQCDGLTIKKELWEKKQAGTPSKTKSNFRKNIR